MSADTEDWEYVTESRRTGFETTISMTDLEHGTYLRARASDINEKTLGWTQGVEQGEEVNGDSADKSRGGDDDEEDSGSNSDSGDGAESAASRSLSGLNNDVFASIIGVQVLLWM